ncbi:hypothetical protein Tco_0404319 [Tanacetum coccineum]
MRHSMRMLVKDTRSQDGKDDKNNDKGSKSRSQSMKEQAYNKEQRERPRPHELNDKSNLIDLMKEYAEGHGLDDGDHGLEDEGLGLEEEDKAVPEGQQQAVLAVNTAIGEPLGLGYRTLRHHELAVGEHQAPSTFY